MGQIEQLEFYVFLLQSGAMEVLANPNLHVVYYLGHTVLPGVGGPVLDYGEGAQSAPGDARCRHTPISFDPRVHVA